MREYIQKTVNISTDIHGFAGFQMISAS